MSNITLTSYMEITQVEQILALVEQRLAGPNVERWLRGPAHDHLTDKAGWAFATEGSGAWESLSPATENIRESLGYNPSTPINRRTNEMFEFLTNDSPSVNAEFSSSGMTAEMNYPGDTASPRIDEKIKTAQQGRATNPIPNFGPTPPRPVLGAGIGDMEALLSSFTNWFMVDLAFMGSV